METISKLIDILCLEKGDNETPENVFLRYNFSLNMLPSPIIIDIVHHGGLIEWAKKQNVTSQSKLFEMVFNACRKTISESVFNNKKTVDIFPPLANFFYYCQKLDRSGKLFKTCETISEAAWISVCRSNLNENLNKIFSVEPDVLEYEKTKEKIKNIGGFSDKDIDAFRCFVCQTRHKNHNPSLNKSLYIWGDAKKTGKTTIARALITILNGDKFENFGRYESNLSKELQYNDHDLPLAALYNAVLLDEAMPKDSSKSYGQLKQMLTSNSCSYNQKFEMIKTLECNRYYIFGSNHDIKDHIIDKEERRFLSVNIEKRNLELEFSEIYDIWLKFCVNSVPEDSWQIWYDSFGNIDGIEKNDIEEIKSEIMLNKENLFGMLCGSTTTVKKVASLLFKNEPTRDQKKTVAQAMDLLFLNCRYKSNKSFFSIPLCRERLAIMNEREELDLNVMVVLPF